MRKFDGKYLQRAEKKTFQSGILGPNFLPPARPFRDVLSDPVYDTEHMLVGDHY